MKEIVSIFAGHGFEGWCVSCSLVDDSVALRERIDVLERVLDA